jgi:DUF1365 family protein
MHSCIYEGTIRHRRFTPVVNQFRYRLFMLYLDLAELPKVFDSYRLWSVDRPNLAAFCRSDHTGDPEVPLDRAIRDLVAAKVGRRLEGPIRILTHLRYFGYCFNPVSFYYCYDQRDADLDTVVVEIHNTPWLEEHLYVCDPSRNLHPLSQWRRCRFRKEFHVSPFMDMDIEYDWRFRIPGPALNVHMVNISKGRRIFDASLALSRKPLNRAALVRVLLHYPLMTAKVTAMIYWQALRLHLKGAPFYVHPAKRQRNKESA